MDNKRVLLAVVLSLGVLVSWNFLFVPSQMPQQPQEQAQQAPEAAEPAKPEVAEPVEAAAFKPTQGRQVLATTPLYQAEFNSEGGLITHFRLTRYRTDIAPGAPAVDLVGDDARDFAPMGLLLGGRGSWREGQWAFEGQDLSLESGQQGTLTFTGQMQGIRVAREFSFDADNYLVKETVRLLNTGQSRTETRIGFTMAAERLTREESRYNMTRVAWAKGGGLEEEHDADDLEKGQLVEGPLEWGGVQSNYFLMAMVPETAETVLRARMEQGVYRVAVEKRDVSLEPGQETIYSCSYYLGPKKAEELAKGPKSLETALRYGWFDFISKPLMQALLFFNSWAHNYGTAIILLTVLIKIIFLPLSHKSYKSMESMKKLQPMMAKIREKYKDDKQRMNQEMMGLYKTYKVNPAGGCLPMVVQIPVFIGLYQALMNAIELRHAPFITHVPFTDITWLADLSAKDPFYVTPIIMGATMFLQQKMTPSPGDPTQAKIMLLMPVFFTFLFLSFPSGLVIYWLVNNVLSIAQQWWMLRKA